MKAVRYAGAAVCLALAVYFMAPLVMGILHIGMVYPAALLALAAAMLLRPRWFRRLPRWLRCTGGALLGAGLALLAAVLGALFVGCGVGLSVRAGGAPGGDDALAMSISKLTRWDIQWAYLISDLVVLALSATYIDLSRLGCSLLTVILSGQIIGLVQRVGRREDTPVKAEAAVEEQL